MKKALVENTRERTFSMDSDSGEMGDFSINQGLNNRMINGSIDSNLDGGNEDSSIGAGDSGLEVLNIFKNNKSVDQTQISTF